VGAIDGRDVGLAEGGELGAAEGFSEGDVTTRDGAREAAREEGESEITGFNDGAKVNKAEDVADGSAL
jgi:hypothetical protein